ncbi:MAG: hypothetical protein PHW04_00365 [Candidatus Wallbacteria bacterium]|nr:hypothetical protein [Candidatus Wallbacteria bacterium]
MTLSKRTFLSCWLLMMALVTILSSGVSLVVCTGEDGFSKIETSLNGRCAAVVGTRGDENPFSRGADMETDCGACTDLQLLFHTNVKIHLTQVLSCDGQAMYKSSICQEFFPTPNFLRFGNTDFLIHNFNSQKKSTVLLI